MVRLKIAYIDVVGLKRNMCSLQQKVLLIVSSYQFYATFTRADKETESTFPSVCSTDPNTQR